MKGDALYLKHILDAVCRIDEYTVGGKEAFLADTRTQDAVVRNLEIVGEAAKRVSARARGQSADVPWKQIAGMRDKLIHEYFGVNLEIVWQVVERDLPVLRSGVEGLLRLEPPL